MKGKLRFTAFIPALALSCMLSFGAGAQGVVDDVIDGAENIVTDTIDTADEILTGDDAGATTAEGTQDEDIPDNVEEDTNPNPNGSKDENDVGATQTGEADANPGTGIGIPFVTAGLVAVSAAGVAYLTRKQREDNRE